MSSMSSRSIISTPVETPEFVEIDLRNNSCPICRNVLRDCVQLPCGHKTCESCIHQLFNNSISEGTCPVNDEDCFAFSRNDVVPDYGTRREILKSKVYCPYKTNGCATVIEWQKLQNHKESCEHKPRECPNRNDGCQEILSFKDITDHITNHCLYSLVSCSHCQSPVMRKDLQNHRDDCTRFPISCKFHCDVGELPREEMKVHENSCPKKLAKCPYASAGCTFEDKKSPQSTYTQKRKFDASTMSTHSEDLVSVRKKVIIQVKQKKGPKKVEEPDQMYNYVHLSPEEELLSPVPGIDNNSAPNLASTSSATGALTASGGPPAPGDTHMDTATIAATATPAGQPPEEDLQDDYLPEPEEDSFDGDNSQDELDVFWEDTFVPEPEEESIETDNSQDELPAIDYITQHRDDDDEY